MGPLKHKIFLSLKGANDIYGTRICYVWEISWLLLLIICTCNVHSGRKSHLQLQDQDDLCLVFKDLVQGYNVGVMDLLQDVHLTLDVLPGHPTSTWLAASLLDEFGSVLNACTPVSASSDHSKLTARRARKGNEHQECIKIANINKKNTKTLPANPTKAH